MQTVLLASRPSHYIVLHNGIEMSLDQYAASRRLSSISDVCLGANAWPSNCVTSMPVRLDPCRSRHQYTVRLLFPFSPPL